jgi:DNA adenine methylase
MMVDQVNKVVLNNIGRPVLRYHGGKWLLAPWIISHFPNHRTYVEPFAGAGSVLMRKQRSHAEIYNDRWGIVVNVFRVLRDTEQAERLKRLLYLTPFSRDEFRECANSEIQSISDPVERARRSILRSFAGFGSASTNGEYSTGFRSGSRLSGTTPAHDWAHYTEHIEQFVERLRGVVIENKDAAEVIRQHDGTDVLIYADPPYVQKTRNMRRGNAAYHHDMTDDDHRALAGELRGAAGMVVISGYPCELYDEELYSDWSRKEIESLADGARPRTEVLWLNKSCSDALATEALQRRLF